MTKLEYSGIFQIWKEQQEVTGFWTPVVVGGGLGDGGPQLLHPRKKKNDREIQRDRQKDRVETHGEETDRERIRETERPDTDRGR